MRWRFRPAGRSPIGAFASTPLVVGRTVYVQDLSSSVYALDARTGRLLWATRYAAPNDGPNGLAVAGSRVFGATDTTAFALDRATGRRLWSRRLESRTEQFVDIAPLAARGLVFTSTIGYAPRGRGALYALDQRTGEIRWRFDTVRSPWRFARAGGGGAWYPASLDGRGRLYVGIANPGPWGGTKAHPNGGLFPGPVPYTDSLVVLDSATGKLLWSDQVTPHDVRDYDFHLTPILTPTRVFGAGKAGRVVAWDRATRKRVWATPVGTHLHDLGPLPRQATLVCPGLWGGVLTPMALAAGRLFVPVVEQCVRESAVRSALLPDATKAAGVVYALDAATGRKVWSHAFPSAPFSCATVARDVVFVPTFDGRVSALSARDGRLLWSVQAGAGAVGCPAVTSDLLLVGTGVGRRPSALVAYGLPPPGA